jgi:hypothetical protein
MEMPKMQEKEPTSIVDEFCKDLYNFLEESKVENKSRSISKYLKIFKWFDSINRKHFLSLAKNDQDKKEKLQENREKILKNLKRKSRS